MEFLTSLEFGKLIWLILGVFEVIVRLTPSQADNSILNKVIWIVEKLVPNKSSDSKNKDKLKKVMNFLEIDQDLEDMLDDPDAVPTLLRIKALIDNYDDIFFGDLISN